MRMCANTHRRAVASTACAGPRSRTSDTVSEYESLEAPVSAQPIHPEPDPARGQVKAIPRTINAIGDALTGEKRARFYREVLAAEQGEQLDATMERWWLDAMLDQVPGRAERIANAKAGRNLRPLADVIGRPE